MTKTDVADTAGSTAVRPADQAKTPARRGLRLVAAVLVLALDVVAAIWLWSAVSLGLWLVTSVVVALLLGLNIAVFVARATALRWLLPALAFVVAFTLAPIVYTLYVATTNYSGVHLLTQQQAVDALERQTFIPEGATPYDWAAYESDDDQLGVFLVAQPGEELEASEDSAVEERTDDTGEDASEPEEEGPATLFAVEEGDVTEAQAGTGMFGPPDEDGFPESIEGWTRLNPVETVQRIGEITRTEFGTDENIYRVLSVRQAGAVEQVYEVDDTGAVVDRRTGEVYHPTSAGYFTSDEGERLSPAYYTSVGLDNVVRLFTNDSIRSPFLGVLAWTIVFAIVVVGVQFALGLLYAVVLTGPAIPPAAGRVIRSILLLPYVVPAYLLILTWAALFNQQTGLIPDVLEAVFGFHPSWVATPNGARLAMLIVGVWLGVPYFLLINTGALQAIPGELLEAAAVDGAGGWKRFWAIILPLLMRMIAPLVVLATAFNFNNFLIAYLLFGGGPPKANSAVPAGETDLLISFTYKLSFDFGGAEYALAAVVTVMIFLMLTPVVLTQLRYYNAWLQED